VIIPDVSSDILQLLELIAAHIAGIQIGAVHLALVSKDAIFIFGCKITLWKVASEWAKGNVPVLGSVLLEVSGRGEGLIATVKGALEHTWGLGLVFQHMFLKVWSVSFDYLTTELALKLISFDLADILLMEDSFVIVQMLFEIRGRSECLLAPVLGAFDDTRFSSLVDLCVPLMMRRIIEAFATKLAT
jgi:hypothetical protein